MSDSYGYRVTNEPGLPRYPEWFDIKLSVLRMRGHDMTTISHVHAEHIRAFVAACTVPNPFARIKAPALYEAYRDWAAIANAGVARRPIHFFKLFARHSGYERTQISGRAHFIGLEVPAADPWNDRAEDQRERRDRMLQIIDAQRARLLRQDAEILDLRRALGALEVTSRAAAAHLLPLLLKGAFAENGDDIAREAWEAGGDASAVIETWLRGVAL